MAHDVIAYDSTGALITPAIGTDSVVSRVGTNNVGGLSMSNDSFLVKRGALDLESFSVLTNSYPGRKSGGLSQFIHGTNTVNLRGSGALDATSIPDSNFVGRPVGGSLGAVTALEAHAILQGLGVLTLVTKTADYTAVGTDEVILCDATSGSFTISLPAVSGTTGKPYYIKKLDSSANTVTVDGNASETIDDGLTAVLTDQYESITIVSDGTERFII